MKKQRGFTLLELLVVIGIIGILVSIGSISYTSAQKRARDSRRRGDIEAVSKAMEQYNAENAGSYPADTSCSGYESYLAGGAPTDPKTGVSYISDGDCDVAGSQFCVCALMEVEGTGNAYAKDVGDLTTCVWSAVGTKDYYCVQNQQ